MMRYGMCLLFLSLERQSFTREMMNGFCGWHFPTNIQRPPWAVKYALSMKWNCSELTYVACETFYALSLRILVRDRLCDHFLELYTKSHTKQVYAYHKCGRRQSLLISFCHYLPICPLLHSIPRLFFLFSSFLRRYTS